MIESSSINQHSNTSEAVVISQYLPSITFFKSVLKMNSLVINGNEYFQKSTSRNRCMIVNANGPLFLSIPLSGGRGIKSQMKDVRIAYDEPWQKIHWRSITVSYGKSSYLLFYEEDFRKIYEKKFEFLIDFNTSLLEVCLKILKMEIEVSVERDMNYYNSLQAAQNPKPISTEALPQVDKTQNPKPYHQVFDERHGFIADASIIDLIFNLGNEAGAYLKN